MRSVLGSSPILRWCTGNMSFTLLYVFVIIKYMPNLCGYFWFIRFMQQPVKDSGDCHQRDDDDDDHLDGLEFCLAHDLPDDTALVGFEDAPPAAVDAAIGTPANPFGHAFFEIPAVARFETL